MNGLYNLPHIQPRPQQVLQLENGPKLSPGIHLLLRLRAGQKLEAFDYCKSIRELGELLKKYAEETYNDNISVVLRDWGFQLTKLDLRQPSKIKQMVSEQLDRLATRILVNQIDLTPLQEPVFLGEAMGKFAEFVGEKKMFEEYLQFMQLPTHTLKVHAFARDILAWIKPIEAWLKQPIESQDTALAALNPTGILPVGPTATNLMATIIEPETPQVNANPFVFPAFNIALDPAIEAEMRMRQRMQKIYTMLPGGFYMQGWLRREVEQRNGVAYNEQQRASANAALQANLDRQKEQMDAFKSEMHTAIDDLKHFHDAEIGILKERQEDLLKEQEKTYDRLVAEEKHSANLQTQVHYLNDSLHKAWARINDLANNDGGGFCVVQ